MYRLSSMLDPKILTIQGMKWPRFAINWRILRLIGYYKPRLSKNSVREVKVVEDAIQEEGNKV